MPANSRWDLIRVLKGYDVQEYIRPDIWIMFSLLAAVSRNTTWYRTKYWGTIPSLHTSNPVILHRPAYEDGTDKVFRNVGF